MTTETLPQTAPLEPTTPIKPSEAIRLGCLLAPVQAFDAAYISVDGTRACVYGAMALGFSGPGGRMFDATDVAMDLHGQGPVAHLPCPVCGDKRSLAHLNDDHRWSRERISDWLESLGL